MEYQYCQNSNSDKPIMVIDRHIGFDPMVGNGVDGSQFCKELMMLDASGVEEIDIWINSVGGMVIDGMSIYNAILNTKAKVNTVCVGLCASISAVIFMAGRKRIMSDYGILMFHDPYTNDGTISKATELMRGSIATMISQRSNKNYDEVINLMSVETWLDSSQAIEFGFATEIQESNSNNKRRTFKTVQEAYNCFNSALNLKINQQPTTDLNMDKVCNKLSLVKGSNEDIILDAISKIEAELMAKTTDLNIQNKTILDLNTKVEELTKERNSFEAKVLATEIEIENAKKEAIKSEAKVLIDSFVNKGIIKNDSAEKWLNLAISDLTMTKEILEDLPFNKIAPRIEVENKVNAGQLSYFEQRLNEVSK